MIPRIFHRIWWSDGPALPALYEDFWKTWAHHHPGWEMRHWEEKDLPSLANRDLYERATELAPGFEGQLRSDVARLEILLVHGGVYLDTDYECFTSIEPLLHGVDCFAAWELQGKVANNAILGCTPGHSFVAKLIANLAASVLANPGARPAKTSGPHYLTAQLEPGVTIFPQAMFYAVGCKELGQLGRPPGRHEYARHHWNNQKRLRGIAV